MLVRLTPIVLREARAFVVAHHRHNKAPRGWKFGIGLTDAAGALLAVATVGRPSAKALQDGSTCEVTRVCTLGYRNASTVLYGAAWKAARAMGYRRGVTYTRQDESGASLKAAGWTQVKNLPPRPSWRDSSIKLRELRDTEGDGNVARIRWEILAPIKWHQLGAVVEACA